MVTQTLCWLAWRFCVGNALANQQLMNFFTELCACLNNFRIYLDATPHAFGGKH